MKRFEILQELSKYDTETDVSKCCWENGADRLARYRIATNQFVKKNKKIKSSICEAEEWSPIKQDVPVLPPSKSQDMNLICLSSPPRATCKKNQVSPSLSLSS